MENKNKMLAIIESQATAKELIKFLLNMSLNTKNAWLTLAHILKESTGEKALMGEKIIEEKLSRGREFLDNVKSELLSHGFIDNQIETDLIRKKNSTVTDCVVEKIKQENYSVALLGRKYNMSKAEEFVLGDVSSRLLRAPIKTTVVVLKTGDAS